MLGIWLSITHFTSTLTSTFHSVIKNTFIISRRDMSRNGTSAIYESIYYLEIVMQSLPPSGTSRNFNIPS